MKHKLAIAAFGLLLLAAGVSLVAALLGVTPGLPTTTFTNPSLITYNVGGATGSFTLSAGAKRTGFAGGVASFAATVPPASIAISIVLNSADATVFGGDPTGPDFVLRGKITDPGPGGLTYDGTGANPPLLTGEILQFGFNDGTIADNFDFRFRVTGGQMAPLYSTKDIGVQVTSDNGNTFAGVFTSNFGGNAKGSLGPIPGLCGSIGDYVWNDLNGNGIQDPNEPGINGVAVNLYDGSDNFLATTTTGNNPAGGGAMGYYQFPGQCAGTYKVSVDRTSPALAGVLPSPANQGTPATDSNSDPATVLLAVNGDSNQTIDFGFYACGGKIGDYLWHDLNRNGIQDNGEPGIDGVTVNLLNGAGGFLTSTTTAGGGLYQFPGLCGGDYKVDVVEATLPAGYGPTTPNAPDSTPANDSNPEPAPVTLPNDFASDTTIDFGYLSPCSGTIGNYVWYDANQNGIQDAGEVGIDNVKLELRDNTGTVVLATTTTNVDPNNNALHGYYQFTGVCAGTYQVVPVNVPPQYIAPTDANAPGSTPDTDSNPIPATVTLPADNSNNQSIDFGYISACAGEMGNLVWLDENRNGVQDGGESGLSGVTVNLRNPSDNSIITSVPTGANGAYLFSGFCPGDYKVEVVPPAGMTASTPNQSGNPALDSNPNPSFVNLPFDNSSDLTIDFGFYCTGSIGNLVWTDLNANGIQDGGEPGIPNTLVELKDSTGTVIDSMNTDGNGLYTFGGLCAGDYTVLVATPGGYTPSPPAPGNPGSDSNGSPAPVTLPASNTSDDTIDFGFYEPVALGDFVWEDLNGNGQQDNGEPGINGVSVNLYRCSDAPGVDPALATKITAGNGGYLFTNLAPGCYKLEFVTPGGYSPTLANTGADATDSDPVGGVTTNYTLVSGIPNMTVDAGFVQPASLGDVVWNDTNLNGQQDPTEPRIPGATVMLTDCSGSGVKDINGNTVGPYTTLADGFYQFLNLVPGQYEVKVTLPGGTVFTVPFTGAVATDSNIAPATGTSDCRTLVSGQFDDTVDAGAYLPRPVIDVEKFVNGQDADTPPGVYVTFGAPVTWTFTVTNTGNVTLSSVQVTDPLLGAVTCPKTTLTAGESMNCTPIAGTAVGGQYTNTASVEGTSPQNVKVTDADPANYFGATPAITIVKKTNGTDNDLAPGINIPVGGAVAWTYDVKNTGNVTLTNVAVTDSKGVVVTCPKATLAVGETMTCTASGVAVAGLYENIGSVTGKPPVGPNVTASNPDHYYGFVPTPGMKIVKTVDKPTIAPYEMVTYSYVVTNTGGTTLTNIVVTDDNGTPATASDDFTVGTIASLLPGASQTLTAAVIPVVTTTSVVNGNPVTAGAVIVVVQQANGDVKVTYLQDFGINDNTYGTGAIGWPNGHTFGNLTGSDKLEFRFFDKNGNVVIDFYVDTITAANSVTVPGTGQVISYPSGYGTLGPFGGDGFMVAGDPNNIRTFSTSISENLNNPLNVPKKATLIVNSPTSLVGGNVVVNMTAAPGDWNHINNYSVVIKGSAFTAGGGFGGVAVPDQHNSPNKLGGPNGMATVAKNSTVVNTAKAVVASAGNLTATATASVDIIVPSQPCSLTMTTTQLGSKALQITILNSGPSDAVLSAFQLTWPTSNGKLVQINLDGDVVYAPDITAPSANLTTAQLAAASTDAKRTIQAGTSDVLKMTFQNNVNPALSNYTGSFTFGGCTLKLN